MTIINPKAYCSAAIAITRDIFVNSRLVAVLAKREITERYIGQVFGAAWAILHPLAQMAIYWFIFAVVFKVRIPEQSGLPQDYFLYILSGMAPWLFFSEAMNKGATSITSQASLVKQVVFPLEVLPVKCVIASCLPFAIMGTFLLAYKIGTSQPIFPGLLLLPPALFMQLMLCTGLNLVLGAVGVYLRDIKDFIQTFTLMIIYVMPMFYLPEMVPAHFRPVLSWNPLSHLIWCWQDVFFFNNIDHPISWAVTAACAVIAYGAGARTFKFLKHYFGNAL